MIKTILRWIRKGYKKTITSIAFLPAIIAIIFLILSFLMVAFDFSETGKNIKSNLHWLSLKDASTARSICSAIAGGVISLAVFSFSMVMILLNQAASQMSNRILDKLIGNRFQQFVLGFYIGTIIYALYLLSTIRDINSGIYVPAISTYLLITLTIVDIFLFIYFLHYITDSVKYGTIIHRIYTNTKQQMKKDCPLDNSMEIPAILDGFEYGIPRSGIYQGFDQKNLLLLCEEEDLEIIMMPSIETYLVEGAPLFRTNKDLTKELALKIKSMMDIGSRQQMFGSYYTGMRHLMEIAIRALSPGINDPDTAIISMQALTDLLAYKAGHFSETVIKDANGKVRILVKEKTFTEIFEDCMLPIWDYGKNDRLIIKEMQQLMRQLKTHIDHHLIEELLIATKNFPMITVA